MGKRDGNRKLKAAKVDEFSASEEENRKVHNRIEAMASETRMGKRDGNMKLKAAKVDECSASEEENRKVHNRIEAMSSDDDEEANEDLSLKIVQKAMLRACNRDPENDGVVEIVTDLKKGGKKEKKRKKSTETKVPEDAVSGEIDKGFRDFCGELFLVDNVKGEEKVQTDKAVEISEKAVGTNPLEVSDNAVLRKLLRGPRYFDPPDNNSWGACYNCGEEGHTTVNCTSARRKKPCFVCGSFEHNAKQCSKGRYCYMCKQQGHRAKDCPEKNSSKMCLKCGDFGHDMFQCRNEYCPDDLKEIQCYACHRFGHLCCADYGSPSKKVVSCYKCGGSGHTGLTCTRYHGETSGTGTPSSCYKCGEGGHFARECTSSVKKGGDTSGSCYKCGGEGHFARECTSSKKPGKRNREQSTPKQRSFKKNRDHIEASSASQDHGKTRKKKKSQHNDFSPSVKAKHRGGWITEDPEYYNDNTHKSRSNNNRRSPSTPTDRRSKIPGFNGDYASSSHSSRNHHKLGYSNSAAYGSNGYHEHRFTASRFGNNINGGMGKNYEW